jgi:cytidine deaminase
MLKAAKNSVRYELSCHAEVAALMKVPPGTNMRRVKLLVVRKGMKMSKPCVRCQRVIEALGVRRVYYSCDGALERLDNPI